MCQAKSLFSPYEKHSENHRGCPIFPPATWRWTFYRVRNSTKDGFPLKLTQLFGLWNARINIPGEQTTSLLKTKKNPQKQIIHIMLTTKSLPVQVGLLQSCHLSPLASSVCGSSVIFPLWSAAKLLVLRRETWGTAKLCHQSSSQSIPGQKASTRQQVTELASWIKDQNICKQMQVAGC